MTAGLPPLPPADGFPVYPATFPVAERVPYAVTVDMGVIRSDFAAGNARQRRAYRTMPHALALTFRLRTTELLTWQNWVNAYAFEWFYCPVATMYAGEPPAPGTLSYELLRFTGNLDAQALGWNLHALSVFAELSPAAEAANAGWGAGGWIVGGTPPAPSPVWIIAGGPFEPAAALIVAGSPPIPASY